MCELDDVSSVCRVCDCNPCACGSNEFTTDREEDRRRADRDSWAWPADRE